jgi:hypothetical protein
VSTECWQQVNAKQALIRLPGSLAGFCEGEIVQLDKLFEPKCAALCAFALENILPQQDLSTDFLGLCPGLSDGECARVANLLLPLFTTDIHIPHIEAFGTCRSHLYQETAKEGVEIVNLAPAFGAVQRAK